MDVIAALMGKPCSFIYMLKYQHIIPIYVA